jgi:hypothetical protein
MADQGAIRESAERNVRLLTARPDRGHLSCATRARLVDGLRCEIEEGPWKLAADMPAKVGGDDSAPTPGVLGRGALAGCLTIGIAAWAARLGVPLDAIEVEVQTSTRAASWASGMGSRPDIRRCATSSRSKARLRSMSWTRCSAWPSGTAPISTCSAGRWR